MVNNNKSKQMNSAPVAKSKLWTKEFVLITFINLAVFVGFNMTSTGLPVYISIIGGSDVMSGLSATFCTVAALCIRPLTGLMLVRFERKVILISSIGLMALAIISYAVFPIIGIILFMRIFQGFGWGLSTTVTATVAADTIPKARLAEGLGFFGLAATLAMAIGPALSIGLIQSVGILPMVIIAAISTALSLLLSLFHPNLGSLRSKRKKVDELNKGDNSGVDNSTSNVAIDNDIRSEIDINENNIENNENIDESNIENRNENVVSGLQEEKGKRKFLLSDFFEKKAVLPAIMIFLINCAFASIMTFIALHGIEREVDNIYLYFTVYAIATVITRPPLGRLMDRIGFFLPVIFATICLVTTLVLISLATNIFMFCVAGMFGGIGLGTAMSALQTMAVAFVPAERRGVATSTFLFGLDAGVSVGAVFAGFLANATGYANMFMILILFPILAALLFIVKGRKM